MYYPGCACRGTDLPLGRIVYTTTARAVLIAVCGYRSVDSDATTLLIPLIIASIILGNSFFKYIKVGVLSIALMKFFINLSLICNGGMHVK